MWPLNVRKMRPLSVRKMRLLNVRKMRPLNVRKMRPLNVRKIRLLNVRKMWPLNVRKILSSSSQESSVGVETSREWQPTLQVEHQLRYQLSNEINWWPNNPSQVSVQVRCFSSSSQRYYRKKASQAVDTVLNAIAQGDSSWLLQKTFEKYHSARAVPVTSEEDLLVSD